MMSSPQPRIIFLFKMESTARPRTYSCTSPKTIGMAYGIKTVSLSRSGPAAFDIAVFFADDVLKFISGLSGKSGSGLSWETEEHLVPLFCINKMAGY